MDYQVLRKIMVEEQLVARGIKDERVLSAFYKMERHKFVATGSAQNSYADHPIAIGQGQTISQPYIVALMTEKLDLKGDEKVLEIGTGSGYQTAILAELVKEVFTIERFKQLADRAEKIFEELKITNIKSKIADGTEGWKDQAPFDRIIITAAAPRVPPLLLEQLRDGGKLILPQEDNFSQVLNLVEKKNGQIFTEPICGCVFVPLVGKYL